MQRPRGHRYDACYMTRRHTHNKHDTPLSINVIVCFSARGLGFIHCFEEELDSALLIRMLSKHVKPAIHKMYEPGEDYKLLWDNDSTHTSNKMQAYLEQQHLYQKIVKIPARSPEFNPTENLFANLAPRVERHNATTVAKLKKAIELEWEKTDLSLLKRLSDSMIKRCSEVIASEGHRIDH